MTGLITHAWFDGLFADPECAEHLSPDAELARYRDVEIAWTLAQGDAGLADPGLCARVAHHIETCAVSDDVLRAGVVIDGLPIPALVRTLKLDAPEGAGPVLHSGLTSQDVMDTAMVLSLRPILGIYRDRLLELAGALDALATENAGRSLMGYTRMQAALPITADARLAIWVQPLVGFVETLDGFTAKMSVLQWGGPVGLRTSQDATAVGGAFAARLGLRDPGHAWHATRDGVAELGGFIARFTGTLGKMGQDIALMAQRGADDITLTAGGSSSAMPHKQNPILAELLVSLAQYTAQQSTLLNVAMVHEQERSGAAWVLEMMTLRDLLQLGGRALQAANTLTAQIVTVGRDA